MSNEEESFYVTASQKDTNGNEIYHYVPAKYDIESGFSISDVDWGQTFVGNNGKRSTVDADVNDNYVIYDSSGTPLPDDEQNAGRLIVPANYSFGDQIVQFYDSIEDLGDLHAVETYFNTGGGGDLQNSYSGAPQGFVRAFTDAGLFNYARLMIADGYSETVLTALGGMFNIAKFLSGSLNGDYSIDTGGDGFGNAQRSDNLFQDASAFEEGIIDQKPGSSGSTIEGVINFSSSPGSLFVIAHPSVLRGLYAVN